MVNICAFINGTLCTIILSGPLIPALWFPATQRVTATGKSLKIKKILMHANFTKTLNIHCKESLMHLYAALNSKISSVV